MIRALLSRNSAILRCQPWAPLHRIITFSASSRKQPNTQFHMGNIRASRVLKNYFNNRMEMTSQ